METLSKTSEGLKNWFRGSVLEEVLIPYTLPGSLLVVLMAVLLPPDTLLRLFLEGHGTNPIIILIVAWAMSIAVSASESALGRLVDDWLPERAKDWLAHADKSRNEKAIEALGLSGWKRQHERYELLRSRLYVWAEFNRGMAITFPIYALFLPVLGERYFPWISLHPIWMIVLIAILVVVEFAIIRNWQRNLRRWEWFEKVR
jgi:hypothetical protein